MKTSAVWQRKTLTVLLTDVCGSTRLSREMELESYGELLLQVAAIWSEAARLHGGIVSRIQGDGCMILFGHEKPGERDVVDAIDAGLFIHQRLATLAVAGVTGLPRGLQAKSGIHSGVALIRPGDSARGLHDVMGEAPNIAGTLEKHARPGELLVTVGSLKPNEGSFVLEPRRVEAAEVDLRDDETRPGDVAVVRVASRRPGVLRYEATTARGLTPLIGRDDVIAALRAFLSPRGTTQAHAALLTAAPGLGKTRLLREAEALPEAAGYHVMRGTCDSYRDTEVLQPFVQMLRHELEAGPDPEDRARIDAALATRRDDLLVEAIEGLGSRERLLLVIDDWQWADDASRRLLPRLLERPARLRLILGARPDPSGAAWVPEALHLRLDPWDEAQSARAVRRWLTDADPILIAKLHGYAGGVPLLVEELCHSNSSFRLWQTLEGRGTPRDAGLKLLVAARLAQLPDRLSTAVQSAAVIGNESPRWLLEEVCGFSLGDDQLTALADQDFLHPGPGDSLRFKHGITRETVYEHVPIARRRVMHRHARRALEARTGSAGKALAALAYHCDGAGDWEAAARFSEQAGDEALGVYSMDLARSHYGRAMESLARLEPGADGSELASARLRARWCDLSCRFAMASIFDPLALPNDTATFEKAVSIAEELGDDARRAQCLQWLGYMLYGFGRFREGAHRVREAVALSRRIGQEALASQCEAVLGQILAGTGDYDEALKLIDTALAARQGGTGARRGGPGIGSAYTLACKGSVLADRGRFEEAHAAFGEALRSLGRSTHPVGNSVRNWIVVAHIWQGRWADARRVATESLRIAENTGALYLVAVSRSTLGFAEWCENGDPRALQRLSDAVQWMIARRGRLFTSLHFAWLAEALVSEGRTREARELVARVLQRVGAGERLGEAIASRAMARAALTAGRFALAGRWLERADRSARARASVREQALNGLTRARLLRRHGDGDAAAAIARDALATIDALQIALPAHVRRDLN